MLHSFISSQLDTTKCAICTLDEIAHSNSATCESCDAVTSCDSIMLNGIRSLLCPNCMRAVVASNSEKFVPLPIQNHRDELQGIRFNGDVFNSKLTPLIELRKSINDDVAIEDKNAAFQRSVLERIEHLKIAAFEKDSQILAIQKELQDIKIDEAAHIKTLRDLGNDLRKESRDKLKELDDKYQPIIIKKPVIAKVAKRLSAFDKVIQKVALAKGIQFEEAKKLIESNPALMAALKPSN